ncbi:hypothetical protein PEDI_17810 [Persicobacter diffluens]|uniref:BIG2 domain-containing protein n=2 Tax=Persicobacter diffluens TaxID=981 RepID=A0AAN4VW70_9BACT|nr:hypothetical protein PEDI_17810 [Persicobacter diffluens]
MKMRTLFFRVFGFITAVALTAAIHSDFFDRLKTERVESEGDIVWSQVGPGNAGFANVMRYHPTIPQKVATIPDMWNAYQSDNNGISWYHITDSDGKGEFYHIRDLYYSPKVPEFGIAISSARMYQTHDTGRSWQIVPNCPWYKPLADGDDQESWKKKVASLAIDPNDENVWFVGGGSFVRGQEWLSCYQTVSQAAPHGKEADFQGDLWRTKDGGVSWELVNTGLPAKAQVGRIIVNPMNSNQVFAASNYGIFRSNDGGDSWASIGEQLDNDIIMDMDFYYDESRQKFILYLIDQVQFVAAGNTTTCTGGIFRSEDNGASWIKMNGDIGLDINRLTGGTPASYYKFIASWFGIKEAEAKAQYSELPTAAMQFFFMLSADPSREGALYVGFADPQIANSFVPGRLWTTSDNGDHWVNTARLGEHVWENDKAYWEERDNPWHENMVVGHESPHFQFGNNYALRSMRGLDVGVDGSVMIISDHSTMLSTDHGASWTQVDEDYTEGGSIIGRGNSNLPGLTIGQDKRLDYMVLGSGEHRVWIPTADSPDERQAMKFIESAQETVSNLAFDPYDANIIYATSNRQAEKQYIYRSSDGGYHWERWGTATPATNKWLDDFYTNGLVIDPINPQYMYHGINKIVDVSKADQGGFFVSKDGGKTFQQSNNGLPNPVRIKDIAFDPRDDSRASLFAAAEKNAFNQESPVAEGGLYHSLDRGANWSKVSTPAAIGGVNEIAIDHANRIYITTGYRGGGAGLWYSDDFGENWVNCFPYAGAISVNVSPFDHHLLVVTVGFLEKNPGVYVSRDRGLNWKKANTGIVTPHRLEEIEFSIFDASEIWIANLGTGFYKGSISGGEQIQVVHLEQQHLDIREGVDLQMAATISNSDYKDETIEWKTENPAVVTVDEKGLLKPVGRGKAKVYATVADGRFADYCEVVVHEVVDPGAPEPPLSADPKSGKLSVAPVPAQDYFSVLGNSSNGLLSLVNMNGQKVLESDVTENVNIAHLPVGQYLGVIEVDGLVQTFKLLKD